MLLRRDALNEYFIDRTIAGHDETAAAYCLAWKTIARFLANKRRLLELGQPGTKLSSSANSANFDIDTGSAQGLTVTKMFAESAGLMEDFSRTSDAVIGHGVGGVVTGTVGRAKTFACGPLLMSGPVVGIAHSDSGVFAQPDVAGNIGGAIWRRFKVALDVPNSKLYLTPNARFAEAFTFNRAGLFSERNAEIEKVILVAPASPAAQAGVLAGDIISNIDGIAVAHLSPDNVAATWLRPVGTRIILGLRRDGKPVSVSLALRDLL